MKRYSSSGAGGIAYIQNNFKNIFDYCCKIQNCEGVFYENVVVTSQPSITHKELHTLPDFLEVIGIIKLSNNKNINPITKISEEEILKFYENY